jgi:hypothetical protein
MRTLPRDQANERWDKLWQAMNQEWFKVEVLQDYTGEDKGESLDAWTAGDKQQSIQLMHEWTPEWANECKKKVSRGVTLTRIHIVDYPLSDYLQWEIEVYKNRNIPLGKEVVYLLDRSDIADVWLPAGDMMIFDQANVVIGNYDQTGYAVTQDFYDGTDDISRFLQLREQLLKAPLQRLS